MLAAALLVYGFYGTRVTPLIPWHKLLDGGLPRVLNQVSTIVPLIAPLTDTSRPGNVAFVPDCSWAPFDGTARGCSEKGVVSVFDGGNGYVSTTTTVHQKSGVSSRALLVSIFLRFLVIMLISRRCWRCLSTNLPCAAPNREFAVSLAFPVEDSEIANSAINSLETVGNEVSNRGRPPWRSRRQPAAEACGSQMRDHHRLLGDENPTSGPQGWRLIDACDLLPRRGEPGMAVQLPSQRGGIRRAVCNRPESEWNSLL
jgi:hypothetical protein